MKRPAVLSLLAFIGLATATATPAAAATVHFGSPESCVTDEGNELCVYVDGQYNVTETPSGNLNYSGKIAAGSTLTFTAEDGTRTSIHESTYDKFHHFTKGDELQVQKLTHSYRIHLGDFDCTYTDVFMLVDGEIKFWYDKMTCA